MATQNCALMNTVTALSRYIKEQLADTHQQGEVDQFILRIFDHLRSFTRLDLIMKRNERLSEEEVNYIREAVLRLKNHEPVQYVLGHTEFMGIELVVNEKVLIPRPETEELVAWILNDHLNDNFSLLDIGTGSGCIPITIKKRRPGAQIEAWDICPDALDVACCNARRNEADIRFEVRDIFNFRKYNISTKDIIVSNPPYVTVKEIPLMQPNVLKYEPEVALFVEDDKPLKYYEAIGEMAIDFLKPGGCLYFEINEAYSREVCALLENYGFVQVERRKDINGRWRMVRAYRP